uniref:serine/threonine/tyrosine-interacting-like protein 1 n=1 Tax=Styela clava TaxID=7725 RepID=UPI00193952E4|nr:serine/threonine/tyrosine-interacting-like protein 1 [Styela clava]
MGNGSSKLPWHRDNAKKTMKVKATHRSNSMSGAVDSDRRGSGMQRAMTDGALQVNFKESSFLESVDQNSNGISFDLKINDLNGNTMSNASKNTDGSGLTLPTVQRKSSDIKVSKYRDTISDLELYNLIIAETWQGHPQIHDTGYLLLLDCREKSEYEAAHIITSRHHSALYSEYGLLMPSQLKLFQIIILYSNSSSCKNILEISKKLSEDEVEHFLLQSGSSQFFEKYPFLSTQGHYLTSDMRNTLQTMPSEILPGRLYQGNAKHALDSYIITSLGITHIVNVTLEHPNRFEDTVKYLRIQLDDRPQVDLHAWLPRTSEFVQSAIGRVSIKSQTTEKHENGKDSGDNRTPGDVSSKKEVVLVHCNLGRSRSSTVVLGYLMQACRMTLKDASRLLKDCRPTVRPNIGFLEQLLQYEKEVFGKNVSDLNDLPF